MSGEISSICLLFLIQEYIRYTCSREDVKKGDVPATLENIGFVIGGRAVERLSLAKPRIWEQRECLKFVCKDLWQFLFQKQADRLQTNRKGGYVIHDNNLTWLRDIRSPQSPDAPLSRFPIVHVSVICGILRGVLASLGLPCVVTADARHSPTCNSENITIISVCAMKVSVLFQLLEFEIKVHVLMAISMSSNTCALYKSSTEEKLFEILKYLRDPEFENETLEELNVVSASNITFAISKNDGKTENKNYLAMAKITFEPTVPHCTFCDVIGLSIITQIQECTGYWLRVEPHVFEQGSYCEKDCIICMFIKMKSYQCVTPKIVVSVRNHNDAAGITKKLADKERVRAALENPDIARLVSNSRIDCL